MEISKFLFVEMMKNYRQVTLIDNDDLEDIHRKYASDMVAFMSKMLGRKIILKKLKGSSEFLRKLMKYEYDDINFLKIKAGQKILQKDFIKLEKPAS
ncbi:MAG: hypothetical protein M1308_07700 [Actinobacteria bacterium]|nr:hypothetical protein [Actinomycetota bacterium]MCL5070764.1 hypothetical protein [Actinomycetota bacterium]